MSSLSMLLPRPRQATRAQAPGRLAMLTSSRTATFLALAAFALLLRAPTLGVWNYEVDDRYYYLVGQRLLRGDTLYVDIWDRKGPLLYAFYAACGWLSAEPWSYQLAATFCVAGTAYFITRLATEIARPGAALLAGMAYCLLVLQFGGENGQAPVIYNVLMTASAHAIVRHAPALRTGRVPLPLALSVGAAGCAIAFKQSVAIEAGFFGLTIAALLLRKGFTRRSLARVALLAILAALPYLATFAWYAHHGHASALWQALVASNLERGYGPPGERLRDLGVLTGRLALPLVFAIMGGVLLKRGDARDRQTTFAGNFIIAWAIVAIAAVIAFPAVFLHYALPVLPPLCVLCARAFDHPRLGGIAAVSLAATALLLGSLPATLVHNKAMRATGRFESYLRQQSPHHRLFVWGVPVALYARLDSRPPSPIMFAPHYYEQSERRTAGLDTTEELRRVLAWRPEAVVVQDPLPMLNPNRQAIALLRDYVRGCRRVRRFDLADYLGRQMQWVYSGCDTPAG